MNALQQIEAKLRGVQCADPERNALIEAVLEIARAALAKGDGRMDGPCGHSWDGSLHRGCPRCSIAEIERRFKASIEDLEKIEADTCTSGYDSGIPHVAKLARGIIDRLRGESQIPAIAPPTESGSPSPDGHLSCGRGCDYRCHSEGSDCGRCNVTRRELEHLRAADADPTQRQRIADLQRTLAGIREAAAAVRSLTVIAKRNGWYAGMAQYVDDLLAAIPAAHERQSPNAIAGEGEADTGTADDQLPQSFVDAARAIVGDTSIETLYEMIDRAVKPKCFACESRTATACDNCKRPICIEHEEFGIWEDASICVECGPPLRAAARPEIPGRGEEKP